MCFWMTTKGGEKKDEYWQGKDVEKALKQHLFQKQFPVKLNITFNFLL